MIFNFNSNRNFGLRLLHPIVLKFLLLINIYFLIQNNVSEPGSTVNPAMKKLETKTASRDANAD